MAEGRTPVVLLDCTLRDGGYAVNFQFTARDVRQIGRGLARAGVRMIEIGHGLGLGASSPRHGVAFERDADYIAAAKEVAGPARIGAFFIPGVGKREDIAAGRAAGLDFLRIGANVTEIAGTRPFVAAAKEMGLEVHLNLMKTYAVDLPELARLVEGCSAWGVDAVYAVDSAGCMLPGQVAEAVTVLKEACGVAVGFHGHNNLDLANANCLAALAAGAVYVDATLRGMGRSSGNAQTEVLAHVLAEAGYDVAVDSFVLFETAERYLKPLMLAPQGQPPLDIVIGMSRFHSSHLPMFRRVLDKYDVDLYRLIMAVSRLDCVNPSEELVESVARDMSRTDG
jgi:4-hydroxy-2-oxovalerate aldolase